MSLVDEIHSTGKQKRSIDSANQEEQQEEGTNEGEEESSDDTNVGEDETINDDDGMHMVYINSMYKLSHSIVANTAASDDTLVQTYDESPNDDSEVQSDSTDDSTAVAGIISHLYTSLLSYTTHIGKKTAVNKQACCRWRWRRYRTRICQRRYLPKLHYRRVAYWSNYSCRKRRRVRYRSCHRVRRTYCRYYRGRRRCRCVYRPKCYYYYRCRYYWATCKRILYKNKYYWRYRWVTRYRYVYRYRWQYVCRRRRG